MVLSSSPLTLLGRGPLLTRGEGKGKLELLGPMLLALLCPDLCNLYRSAATVALLLMQLALAFARLRIVALDHPFRAERLLDFNLVMDGLTADAQRRGHPRFAGTQRNCLNNEKPPGHCIRKIDFLDKNPLPVEDERNGTLALPVKDFQIQSQAKLKWNPLLLFVLNNVKASKVMGSSAGRVARLAKVPLLGYSKHLTVLLLSLGGFPPIWPKTMDGFPPFPER
jgi:hypothetical protein